MCSPRSRGIGSAGGRRGALHLRLGSRLPAGLPADREDRPRLPSNVPVLATTATANDRVIADVVDQLGDLVVLRGPLARRSLRLQSIHLADQAERLAWLDVHFRAAAGVGDYLLLTVADCATRHPLAPSPRHDVAAYYGQPRHASASARGAASRERGQGARCNRRSRMGFDKPDLGFVVHFQRPGSLVAYYQQIGRAGRASRTRVAMLLNGREDDEIHDYFVSTAFPGESALRQVLEIVEAEPGIRLRGIEAKVNMRHTRLAQCLTFQVDQAAYRERGRTFEALPCGLPASSAGRASPSAAGGAREDTGVHRLGRVPDAARHGRARRSVRGTVRPMCELRRRDRCAERRRRGRARRDRVPPALALADEPRRQGIAAAERGEEGGHCRCGATQVGGHW